MGLNVVLVGMMASGKSSVGRRLAARLGRPFLDTDALVEDRTGCTIRDIFASAGEDAFRAHERDAVRDAAMRAECVVSVGGGAVLDETNLARLRASGVIVLLDAPAPVLAARAGDGSERPLLGGDPESAIARLLASRAPRYVEAADHRADATRDLDTVVASIVEWLITRDDVLTEGERERCA